MSVTTPLEALGYPLFYKLGDDEASDFEAPPVRLDQSQRTRVRSLGGMQKEALVTSSVSGETWRLVSDEGDYLDGDDIGPCPLSFLTTGMVCSFLNRTQALAAERGIELRDVTLILDNFYTMKGSALRGDMTGGALPPELEAQIEADADAEALERLVSDAVESAPVAGLVRGAHESLFKHALDQTALSPDRVAELDAPLLSDPLAAFDSLSRNAAPQDPPIIRNTGRPTEKYEGDKGPYTAGESTSLADGQDRILHIRGTCTLREDGLKHVYQETFSPIGTVFEYLSEEPEGHGGEGRAPDAMTYAAAGIGFCFMTQFGRYADIVGKELSAYRVVQDTHFAEGEPETGEPAAADPVETHVFLETPEGKAFARTILDMAEQTCFLHALCRTDLETKVEVTRT